MHNQGAKNACAVRDRYTHGANIAKIVAYNTPASPQAGNPFKITLTFS
jgi:hypothetical protein